MTVDKGPVNATREPWTGDTFVNPETLRPFGREVSCRASALSLAVGDEGVSCPKHSGGPLTPFGDRALGPADRSWAHLRRRLHAWKLAEAIPNTTATIQIGQGGMGPTAATGAMAMMERVGRPLNLDPQLDHLAYGRISGPAAGFAWLLQQGRDGRAVDARGRPAAR